MPCRDDGPPESYTEKQLRAEVTELRALLCEACEFLSELHKLGHVPGLRTWYEAHAEGETLRVRRETLSGLTLKQAQALGLHDLTPEERLLLKGASE